MVKDLAARSEQLIGDNFKFKDTGLIRLTVLVLRSQLLNVSILAKGTSHRYDTGEFRREGVYQAVPVSTFRVCRQWDIVSELEIALYEITDFGWKDKKSVVGFRGLVLKDAVDGQAELFCVAI